MGDPRSRADRPGPATTGRGSATAHLRPGTDYPHLCGADPSSMDLKEVAGTLAYQNFQTCHEKMKSWSFRDAVHGASQASVLSGKCCAGRSFVPAGLGSFEPRYFLRGMTRDLNRGPDASPELAALFLQSRQRL